MSNPQSGLTTTGTVLDRIMAHKLEEVAAAKKQVPEADLRTQLPSAPPTRDFVDALRSQATIALIAEVKKASPSKGVFLEDFDPAAIATEYAQYGASCVSVLTDENFFQGSLDYLRRVRSVIDLPILRKEFILDSYQLLEARAAGADAILLIVACLEDALLSDLHAQTIELGMTALVEAHDETEMERALALSPSLVGINNRDLRDFTVDLDTTVRLAAMSPPDLILVGESGIYTAKDVQRLAESGVHAVLVGESLILAPDRPAKLRELSGVSR